MIDAKLARILSGFFADIAKAYFIATFITPSLSNASSSELFPVLFRGLYNVIIFLLAAWQMAKLEENL